MRFGVEFFFFDLGLATIKGVARLAGPSPCPGVELGASLGQFKPILGQIPVPLALIPVPPALIPVPLARNPVPPALLKRGSGPWPDFVCPRSQPLTGAV